MTVAETFNLALQRHQAGKLSEARELYGQIISFQPHHADAIHLSGLVEFQSGRAEAAVETIRRAIALNPDAAEYHLHLGVALDALGRIDQSIEAFNEALKLRADYPKALSNLGVAHQKKGQMQQAIAAFRKAAELQPDLAEAQNNLGNALCTVGALDEAAAALQRAIALRPNYPEAICNLAKTLQAGGRGDQAVEYYEKAALLEPANPSIASNRFFAMHLNDHDPHALLAEIKRWTTRYADPLRQGQPPFANDRDPRRRLRVGYLSADFREHVVGWCLLPILRNHDHGQFVIYCYSNVDADAEDSMTQKLRAGADVWRRIWGVRDAEAAEMIRSDQIDILIDLSLHTAGNRMALVARKPAPIVVEYLGHLGTSGLSAVDYRFSDPLLDPLDSDLSCYSEQTVRLPHSYWCYECRDRAPDVTPSPALNNGYVTFGCLAKFAKVTPETLNLWARILVQVPDSRLLLHCLEGSHRQAVLDLMAGHGVAAGRIEFVGRQQWGDYMATYGRIDIALDPFPWSGGVTTCDSLWMGVPVITLAGRTVVGRGAASALSNVGLSELIAATRDDYVKIARDWRKWIELRPGLRQRVSQSPLMDAPKFTRDLEAAYRKMWAAWCADGHTKSAENSDDPDSLNGRGNELIERGEADEAIAVFNQLIAKYPQRAEGYFGLGRASLDRLMWEEAVVAFRNALNRQPNLPEARTGVEYAAQQLGWAPRTGSGGIPYVGDVVVLRCEPSRSELPRQVQYLLKHSRHWPAARLADEVGNWLECIRNQSAQVGETCVVTLPAAAEAIVAAIRSVVPGDELIEGDEVNAGQLSHRARATPDASGKIFAVTSVRNGGAELLEHWCRHYAAMGVDRLLVGVFEDVAGDTAEEVRRCAGKWGIATFAQRWNGTSEGLQEDQRVTACRRAGARPDTWIVHTDLDEFQEYPAPPRLIADVCQKRGISVVFGRLVDRVAADGLMPVLRTEPSVWEQFPVACDLTGAVLQGGRSKVMMARFSIRVGVGHHHAHITCPTPPMGTALDYRVHHFKWKADLIERTLAWADQPNASAGWKADSRNFLKWWRACGERLDLSQPILGARNLGAPATMGPLTTQQMLELALREHQARRLEAAEAIYQQVLAVQPNQQDALNLLGVMAHQRGQYDQAVQWIARAISARPTEAAFFVNLGLALTGQKKSDEAIAAFGHAVRLRPDHADALNYLADAHMAAGEMASAVDYWRRAGEARPANAAWGSDLLYAMNFDPRQDAQAIARAGREWDRRHGEPLRASISSHESSREPNRKLRIGYLSQDLKVHVVGFNLLPLLARHDHNQFEIFCYSSSETSDEVTEHLKMCASGWRQIHSTPDAAVADMIRQDKIDILVDLSLHTRGNRLLVMARRPAPVQATYLGCLSSTGLSAIDYRISDPYLDPPETDVSVYSERTIRLPATYWCYHIHEVAPPVAPAPAESNGLVTFGCLNHYCKISDAALELWTLVLRAVPQSRLLVYSDSDRQRRTIAARLAAGGITTDRLEIVGRVKRSEYLARYHRIDMVLDTLPFAGGITTCDALWMGVPVVTLRGRTVAGRGSCSVLSNAGLTELIASTPREYVNIAANWRTWSGRRNELRPRMQDSPLVDAQRFARDMEAAYRRMWTNYCESGR